VQPTEAKQGGALAWARLLRLSLFPSAIADPIAGAVAAGVLWPSAWPLALLAALSSLCVYHGAMAINDWRDCAGDVLAGRDRPLVNGEIGTRSALIVGSCLVLSGVAIAYFAPDWTGHENRAAWVILAVVAGVAVSYNLGMRGPKLGPALLGFCRGGNFLFGAAMLNPAITMTGSFDVPVALGQAPWIAALLYFALVFTVSTLGRYEDGEQKAGPGELAGIAQSSLGRQAVLILLLPFALGMTRLLSPSAAHPNSALAAGLMVAALGLAFYFAKPLLGARKSDQWSPPKVEAIMGLCLSRFVPFGILAIVTMASTWHDLVAAAVLFGLAKIGRRMMVLIPPS
jgi:4-hydroxybenzoate polyprenyltransferase